ncbi:hypothetical protein Tco_1396016, partial [Tanacetum coccineum]
DVVSELSFRALSRKLLGSTIQNGFGDEAWKLENGFGILGRVGICLVLEVMEFADDGVFGLDERKN